MEINILKISLDVLAVWHAGVEFANVSGELDRGAVGARPVLDGSWRNS